MCGGLAVISDVPKTSIYELAEFINRQAGGELIPRNSITKAPSAELRPNQTDQDSLPPYDVLDTILEDYIEDNRSAEQIATTRGYEVGLVRNIIRMVERREYKRPQAAPGLKMSEKAFGVGP